MPVVASSDGVFIVLEQRVHSCLLLSVVLVDVDGPAVAVYLGFEVSSYK